MGRFHYLWVGILGLLICSCQIFSKDYAAELVFPGFPDFQEVLMGREVPGVGEAIGNIEKQMMGTTSPVGVVEAWDVEWLERGGGISRRRVEARDDVVRFRLEKEEVVVITARPIFSDIGCGFDCGEGVAEGVAEGGNTAYFFRSAGFFMGPDRLGEVWNKGELVSRLELRWEDGAAADFLLTLGKAGIEPGFVNMERLRIAINERAKGRPWELDSRRMVDDLVSRKLWVYSFRLREKVETEIAFLPGLWLREYVLSEPLVAGKDGWRGEMAVGYHRFIRRGDLKLAAVYVDSRGDSRIFIP